MSTMTTSTTSSIDPTNGELLRTYPHDSPTDVDAALDRSVAAAASWARVSVEERAAAAGALARSLDARVQQLARIITAEMGKPLAESRAEVEKSVWALRHYAESGEEVLAAEMLAVEGRRALARALPLGPLLAIMPWNYPIWQAVRVIAPALLTGNPIVLKHASNVTGSAVALADAARHAGLPEGLLELLVVPSGQVADIIRDPRIAAVTLTGSDAAGRAVGAAAGAALKKCVLELGGSDPFIVLADADVQAAAAAGVRARFQNAGQSCIAAKRFLVDAAVLEPFTEAFVEAAAGLAMGDPASDGVDLGPMARSDLRDELAGQVRRGVAAGGRLLLGEAGKPGRAAFHSPCVVAVEDAANPLMREETFGPVAPIFPVSGLEQAIAVANDSRFGLSASLWTADLDLAESTAPRLAAGAVFVNAMSASDPRLPFGGVKDSGHGRELGRWGLTEFANTQAVSLSE